MPIRISIFLLSCLLIIASAGCASKTEVAQQTASPQQASSPQQQAAPATTSNTQGAEQPQQQNLNATEGSADSRKDACSLLTSAEIEAVQGEAVKETKPSDRSNGSFAISQCFYSLPTYNKSVSLQVTRSSDKAKPDEAREFWKHTFHKEGEEAREKREKGEAAEKERREKKEEAEKERGGRGEEEEEEGAPPKPVAGIGDEAFWAGGRVAGALYMLKGNAFIRISIGGSGDESAKIEKLKALARKALARL